MASIVKDQRRGVWLIQWWNGERWTRTAVTRKPPGWKPGKTMPARPPGDVKEALAEFVKKETEARSHKSVNHALTLDDFFADYLKGYRATRKPRSAGEFEGARAVFVAWCNSRKLTLVKEVTKGVCNQWMAERASTIAQRTGKPITCATLQKEKGLLAGAWSQGWACGKVLENPWVKLAIPMKPEAKKRGSWSPEQYQRLLLVCRPWLRDLIIVGCHCGLRIKALRLIEWRDIEWNSDPEKAGFGFLRVRPELDKAGKGYAVPIHPALHDVLARRLIYRSGDMENVLAGQGGRPLQGASSTAGSITFACERAGLPKPDSPNHHMRRTFGRWAVLGHLTGTPVPMYLVSRWLGHASVTMTQKYLDVADIDSTRFMLGVAGEKARQGG